MATANEWGAAHHAQFDFLEQQRWLYSNVERVPETGIHFPCSEWNIIIAIHLDGTNRAVSNDVRTVGTCL
jgi:hypothetical protein